jgi:hypothetical protein
MPRRDVAIHPGRRRGVVIDRLASDGALVGSVVQSLADSGLDAEELSYFKLQHEGFTRSRIAAELGWSSVKVERVRRRLNLHLARLRGPAPPKVIAPQVSLSEVIHVKTKTGKAFSIPVSRFSYRERLPSGARVWTLTPLTPSNHENFPNLPISGEELFHQGARIIVTSIDNLKANLAGERAKLTRINERLHKCRVASETAERNLETAQAELKTDQVKAVLEERESPGQELRKKLAGLQNAVHHGEGELAAAVEAQRVQGARVVEMEAQLAARAHEEFREAITAPERAWLIALENFVQATIAVDAITYQHRATVQSLGYTPVPTAPDGGRLEERGAARNMYLAAIQLNHYRTRLFSSPAWKVPA